MKQDELKKDLELELVVEELEEKIAPLSTVDGDMVKHVFPM